MMFGRVDHKRSPENVHDRRRYAESLRPLMARISGFLRSQGLSGCQLDDALQETMTRTWSRNLVTPLDNPLTYSLQVARTVIVDQWRASSPKTDEVELDTLEAPASCPEREHLNKEKLRLVQEAIAQLPPMRRRVFIRRKFEGKSRAQIARELDLPIESVKKHLTRAMVAITLYLESRGLTSED